MKELPKFGFLTNSVGFAGVKVIQLERPYIIASIHEVAPDDIHIKEQFLEAMANERYPIAKVKGYRMFLKVFTSLEPCNNSEYQNEILKEMAEFVLTERIQKKEGQFRKFDESRFDGR
jgi:hypothetical protein